MKSTPNHTDLILIDYYIGAYGPTLRIDVHSSEALYEFKRLFLLLANGNEKEIDIGQLEIIKTSGLHLLILKSILDSQPIEKNLVIIKHEFQAIDLVWSGH